jgi:hypothetical protein
MSTDILVYSHNHFDPTWRRCFDRPAVFNGQVVRSYAEIEDHVIEGWLPGRWDISLLRAPEWNFCAVEPQAYEFWDIDGQRDTGEHHFEYSVVPFNAGLGVGELTRHGYAYNSASPAVPFNVDGDVVVTAWKRPKTGQAGSCAFRKRAAPGPRWRSTSGGFAGSAGSICWRRRRKSTGGAMSFVCRMLTRDSLGGLYR